MRHGTMMKRRMMKAGSMTPQLMMKAGNMTPQPMKKGMINLKDEDDKIEAEEEFKAQQEELTNAKKGKMKKKMFQANK